MKRSLWLLSFALLAILGAAGGCSGAVPVHKVGASFNTNASRPVLTATDATSVRTIASTQNVAGALLITSTAPLTNNLWQWSPSSAAADDGTTVIKPTDIGGGSGRWLVLASATSVNNGLVLRDGSGNIGGLPAGTLFAPLAQVTADFTTSSSSYVDITGLTGSFTTTATSTIDATLAGSVACGSAGSDTYFQIVLGGSPMTVDGSHVAIFRSNPGSLLAMGVSLHAAKLSVSPGTYTYSAQVKNSGGTSVYIRPTSGLEGMSLSLIAH